MTEEKSSPETTSANPTSRRSSISRALRLRIAAFIAVILACAWYSGIFHSIWTTFVPHTCASGDMGLFSVDFNEVPARLGSQFNACANVGDGACQHIAGHLMIQGECRRGQMHGAWSVEDAKMTKPAWSGTFCSGRPCGEFRVAVTTDYDKVFHIENMHIHGATTLWEFEGNRIVQVAGEYKFGKRNGRWVRYAEPEHKLISAVIYDETGFPTTTSYYCSNGNRKEVRGKAVFYYDSQGNILPNEGGADNSALDTARCPLP